MSATVATFQKPTESKRLQKCGFWNSFLLPTTCLGFPRKGIFTGFRKWNVKFVLHLWKVESYPRGVDPTVRGGRTPPPEVGSVSSKGPDAEGQGDSLVRVGSVSKDSTSVVKTTVVYGTRIGGGKQGKKDRGDPGLGGRSARRRPRLPGKRVRSH